MFIGDVNMWRSFVIGRIARNARNATTWTVHSQRCASLQPAAPTSVLTSARERVADERPLLERGPADERDAHAFGDEAGDADEEERAEDHRVFGLGLDADAVRPLDVAAHDRPADADEEHDTREVGAERVRLVDVWPCRNFSDPGSWWSISRITVAMNRPMKPK